MNQNDVLKLAEFIKDYLNYDQFLSYVKELKSYIDKQERLLPKDLEPKLKELESKIPQLPPPPIIPDIEPINTRLEELYKQLNKINPTITNVTEVTEVIKEEFDASSLVKTLTNSMSELKQEIINLIPQVKEYDEEIKDLYNKLEVIKTAPAPKVNSVFRGATKLIQLGDMGISNEQDKDLLQYNSSTGKWENIAGISISNTGITFNQAYEFPLSDGTINQVLATNGSGDIDWTTISSGATINTRDNILALSPTNGDIYYATDFNRFYIGLGGTWRTSVLPFKEDTQTSTNIGIQQGFVTNYNVSYVTDIDIVNSNLDSCVVRDSTRDEDRMLRSIDLGNGQYQLQYYTDGAWRAILTGVQLQEDGNNILEFQPFGSSYWIETHTGNSNSLGLNGRPIIQTYETDIGPNPARRVYSGKYFDGTNFGEW